MERKWKLGDDLCRHDNMLDGFTFDDVITAVRCSAKNITKAEVNKLVMDILASRLQDMHFLLHNNMEEIITEAQRGRN